MSQLYWWISTYDKVQKWSPYIKLSSKSLIKCCRPIDSSICEVFGICYLRIPILSSSVTAILQNLDMEIEIWNSLDYGLMMYKELLQYVVVYMVYVCVLSIWICCIPTLCIFNKSFDTKIIWWWRRSFRFKNKSSEKIEMARMLCKVTSMPSQTFL